MSNLERRKVPPPTGENHRGTHKRSWKLQQKKKKEKKIRVISPRAHLVSAKPLCLEMR